MGRSGKRVRRQQAQTASIDRAKTRKAEKEVFRYLEKRWDHVLEGRRIPAAHREKMRRDPHFQALVAKRVNGEPFIDEDLDHTPDVERRLDGEVTSRIDTELGDDPDRYYCPECGEEQEEPLEGEMCGECRGHFRQTT